MRPRIALTLSRTDTPVRLISRRRYIGSLEQAGAEVLPLEPGDTVPAALDALCLASDAHRFVLGVQWHPERADEVAPTATRVFTAPVEAAALTPTR